MSMIAEFSSMEEPAAIAAGSSIDENSAIIDMADYESVMFITPIVTSALTGVATLTIEQSDENSDTAMTAIDGAVATATASSNGSLNDKVLKVEIRNPSKRYVQAVLTSATANIAYGQTIAILRPRRVPITDGADVAAAAYVSP